MIVQTLDVTQAQETDVQFVTLPLPQTAVDQAAAQFVSNCDSVQNLYITVK